MPTKVGMCGCKKLIKYSMKVEKFTSLYHDFVVDIVESRLVAYTVKAAGAYYNNPKKS